MSWVSANEVTGGGLPMSLFNEAGDEAPFRGKDEFTFA